MKNKFTQTVGGTILALLMLFGASLIVVSGQERDGVGSLALPDRVQNKLEGVWQTTVTQRNCETGQPLGTSLGLTAYHKGGTMSETSTARGPALRGPGFGVWEREGPSTYNASFMFQRFTPDGTFIGTTKIISGIVVSARDGGIYNTNTTVQIFDANNNLLGTGCATATAMRYQ